MAQDLAAVRSASSSLSLGVPWLGSRAGRIAVAVLAMAASAQLKIYLPYSPVPVTLQTAAILLSAALLGARDGVTATLAYLGLGAMGAPFLAGGAGGLAPFLGPTAGYLAGFLAAAGLVGALRPAGRGKVAIVLTLLAGEALIHALGVAGLMAVTGLGLRAAIWQGSVLFWPGAAAKIGLVATLISIHGGKRAACER